MISEDQFKQGMRQLASAVNVITVDHDGQRDGLTATAACSVSAEPPQLLICVNRDALAHDLIEGAGAFCLNILSKDQEDVAMRFAGMDGADRADRYGLGSWTTLETGAPVLEGTLVSFDCTITQQVAAGTHSIFIGEIVAATKTGGGRPLMYGEGQFTTLASVAN